MSQIKRVIPVNLSSNYNIYIGNDLFCTNKLIRFCAKENKRLAIITDENLKYSIAKNIQNIFLKEEIKVELLSFPAGEIHKTRETKAILEDELFKKEFGRDTCLIAVGGGVVSDMVGFVASTFCRGVPVIYIPTTLLAMVDACIGGKTGVNTPYGKNLIGAFTQPKGIFSDVKMLNSLPYKEIANGLVEIIMHSMIACPRTFYLLKKNIHKVIQLDENFLINLISNSCIIKKDIVELDEKEHGRRQLLNFGHTIGHAIEFIENYEIMHGEAVAIGMMIECYISHILGHFEEKKLMLLCDLLRECKLSLKTRAFLNKDLLHKAMKLDKKALRGIPQFILLDDIGKPHLLDNNFSHKVDISILNLAIEWGKKYFSS